MMKVGLSLVAAAQAVGPIQKVLSLLGDMKSQIISEGEAEAKINEEFQEYFRRTKQQLEYNINDASKALADHTAAHEQAEGDRVAAEGEMNDATAAQNQGTAELAAATKEQKSEQKNFAKEHAELEDVIDTLKRASRVLKRAGGSNSPGVSAAQVREALTQVGTGLSAVLSAAYINEHDKRKLQSFMEEDDDDLPGGAPQAAAYENHSTSILDLLAKLTQQGEKELQDSRKASMQSKHQFEMFQQNVNNQLDNYAQALREASARHAAAKEASATNAKGMATKKAELAGLKESLANLTQKHATSTQLFEQNVADREEELNVVSKGIAILSDSDFTAASKIAVKGEALIQTRVKDDVRSRVATILSQTADATHSSIISQLATRTRMGEDPFAKVKGLISDMLANLKKQASEEAALNQWCVAQTKKYKGKKAKKEARLSKLGARSDKKKADIAALTEKIADLSDKLMAGADNQATMTAVRNKAQAEFSEVEKATKVSIAAVTNAIGVLQQYYAKEESFIAQPSGITSGYTKKLDASTGVVGLLEVTLSDLEKKLSDETALNDAEKREFSEASQDWKVESASFNAEKQGSESQLASTKASLSDTKEDLQGVEGELDAVLTGLKAVNEKCLHKPVSFEERAARRAAEIEGLKNALTVLENETAGASFLQVRRI